MDISPTAAQETFNLGMKKKTKKNIQMWKHTMTISQ